MVINWITAHRLVVREIAEGLVDQSRGVARQLEQPCEAWYQQKLPAIGGGDLPDHVAGVGIFGVLRPEDALFFMVDHQADELDEISDVEHRTLVGDFWKNWQLVGKLHQQREIAFAALPVDHRRAEDDDLETVIGQRPDAVLRLDFAVAIAVRGGDGRVLRDHFRLADGGAVAIDDGGAHENELPHAVGLRFLGRLDGQIRVDFVIEGLFFLRDFA